MAAPAVGLRLGYRLRDAKGQTAKMTFRIGADTYANVIVAYLAGVPLLQAITRAYVTTSTSTTFDRTYGDTGDYQTVEDKALFTFRNPVGNLFKFQVPAPKSTIFSLDQETVDETNADVEAWVAWVQTSCYGNITDTAHLALVGAIRIRRKMQRKVNIFTLAPDLAEGAE